MVQNSNAYLARQMEIALEIAKTLGEKENRYERKIP